MAKRIFEIDAQGKKCQNGKVARPCTHLRGLIELFQVSLIGFQKFFLFWVAGMILEAWDVELESVTSFMYYVYF